MWPPWKLTIAVGLAIAVLLMLAFADRDAASPGESCSPIGASTPDSKGRELICSEFTRFDWKTGEFKKTGRGFWRLP